MFELHAGPKGNKSFVTMVVAWQMSWLDVFIKGNNLSDFFIYCPTCDAEFQGAVSLPWFIPSHGRQKTRQCWNWKQSCCLHVPFFCWCQWMPSGLCNGWVSLYKKILGWLVLFSVSALHSTLNLTVIFWQPQVKNKTRLISFSKTGKEQDCWGLLNGKKVQAALETRADICYLLILQRVIRKICFVQWPLPAFIRTVHRKQAGLGYLSSLYLA